MSDPLTTSTRGCARCGGDHDDLTYRPFSRPIPDVDGAFTHWASCPETGDPILMRFGNGERMPTGRVIVMAYRLASEGNADDAWEPLTIEQTRALVRRKASGITTGGEHVWIAYDGLELDK